MRATPVVAARLWDVSLTSEAIRLARPPSTASQRHRDRGPARPDAPDRSPHRGAGRWRWRTGAACRAGPGLLGPGLDRRRDCAAQHALPRPGRTVPAPSSHRRRPRRNRDYAATDWPQIPELYRMLDAIAPSPVVTMNRAVAVAMTDGPETALAMLVPAGRSRPREASPAARRSGPSPRTGRSKDRIRSGLPGGGPPHHESARAALPGPPGSRF